MNEVMTFSRAKAWIEGTLRVNGNSIVLTHKQKTLLREFVKFQIVQKCKPRCEGTTTILLAYAIFTACVEKENILYVVNNSSKFYEREIKTLYNDIKVSEMDRICVTSQPQSASVSKRFNTVILDAIDPFYYQYPYTIFSTIPSKKVINIMQEYPMIARKRRT